MVRRPFQHEDRHGARDTRFQRARLAERWRRARRRRVVGMRRAPVPLRIARAIEMAFSEAEDRIAELNERQPAMREG